ELADRLVDLEPWSESSQRILMRLLAACGKRSAALKQYHACAQILESELGVSPTPETISLFEQIKQWEFADRPEKKPSKPIEGEEGSINIVEPRSKTRRKPSRWVMGFAFGSLMVLAGFIYTQWLKGDQGILPIISENTGNTSPEELTQNTTGSMTTAENDTSSGETNPGTISPSGLLPSQACLPGERLLYLEDFQDNKAQGWPEIEYRAQGWDLVSHPDSPENKVIQFPCETETGILLSDFTFDNAVWRVFFMPKGNPNVISFDWHLNRNHEKWEAYNVGFVEGESVRIIRNSVHKLPEHILEVVLLDTEQKVKQDVWHLLEISTYNTTLEVWLDGTQLLTYVDPQPLPGG
ncbi:MAG: bacterial transcriptional activator domain-containing protein, partial [Anaerolineales bacterium]|nr:bacterial transcriptional activator domain-containing protein [Anaerolineales bacterium]